MNEIARPATEGQIDRKVEFGRGPTVRASGLLRAKSEKPEKGGLPALHPEPEMRVERSNRRGERTLTRERRRPSLWHSPLTRRILAVNIIALAIPVVGLLYLDNYRDNLIQSELELLKTEAKLFSGALAASGVVTGSLGDERLLPETTGQTVRRLVDVSQTRARLFSPDGSMMADSFLLPGPGGVVEMQPLAPLEASDSLSGARSSAPTIGSPPGCRTASRCRPIPNPPCSRRRITARCRRPWAARSRPRCAMPAAGA